MSCNNRIVSVTTVWKTESGGATYNFRKYNPRHWVNFHNCIDENGILILHPKNYAITFMFVDGGYLNYSSHSPPTYVPGKVYENPESGSTDFSGMYEDQPVDVENYENSSDDMESHENGSDVSDIPELFEYRTFSFSDGSHANPIPEQDSQEEIIFPKGTKIPRGKMYGISRRLRA